MPISLLQSYPALWNHEGGWAAAAQAGQSRWALEAIVMPIAMKGTHSCEVLLLIERSYIFSINRTQTNCSLHYHCYCFGSQLARRGGRKSSVIYPAPKKRLAKVTQSLASQVSHRGKRLRKPHVLTNW